jgi:hypothetical protein
MENKSLQKNYDAIERRYKTVFGKEANGRKFFLVL